MNKVYYDNLLIDGQAYDSIAEAVAEALEGKSEVEESDIVLIVKQAMSNFGEPYNG